MTATCLTCREHGREKLGPHEYAHFCLLHLPDFPDRGDCRAYAPLLREDHPVYFTGTKNNQVQHDFVVRPAGDLVEINGVQYTAEDAEKLAGAILQITFPILSVIEREGPPCQY